MSYIKLQDAKNAIDNCINEQTVSKFATSAECKAARYGANIALFALDDVPTADVVEVRHGQWVTPKSRDADDWVECSRCGDYFDISVGQEPTPYCSNCGAKMDGERREE